MNTPKENKEGFLEFVRDMPEEIFHRLQITPNWSTDFHGRRLNLMGYSLEIGTTEKVQSTYPIGYSDNSQR